MLFFYVGKAANESVVVESKGMGKLKGLSVGQLLTVLAGGENRWNLILCRRSGSEVEKG